MICLAIAGSFIAGFHYFTIDRPAQEYSLHPPMNSYGENCYEVDVISRFFLELFGGKECGSIHTDSGSSYNYCCA
ncbi:MAG: hypothetical protein WCH85_00025 [Methanomicrobiales archaeon]